jgi:hypothetical protein
MPQVMINCPMSGQPLPTGLSAANRRMLAGLNLENVRVQCPHCGLTHDVVKNEAFLEGEQRAAPQQSRGGVPGEDEFTLRIFTLADHAATPPDSKLYISGAGIDTMWLQQFPGTMGPLFLAIRLRVPWRFTSDPIPIRIRVLDGDRRPVGPDPLLDGSVEVGRAPGQRPGDELAVNLTVPLTGYPVQIEGTVFIHLIVAGETLGVLPLKLSRLQLAQLVPGRPG